MRVRLVRLARHPVPGVGGEQGEPVVEPRLIEKPRLMQEELLADRKIKRLVRGLGFAQDLRLRRAPPARHCTLFRARLLFLRHVAGNHEAARKPSWFSNALVLRSALLSLSKDARVSKDGRRRDRARGHPSRRPREERGLLRMRYEGWTRSLHMIGFIKSIY